MRHPAVVLFVSLMTAAFLFLNDHQGKKIVLFLFSSILISFLSTIKNPWEGMRFLKFLELFEGMKTNKKRKKKVLEI